MKRLMLALALFVCWRSYAADGAALPFTNARSLLLVTITIDGQQKTMIFDTGAERTVLNDRRNVEHRSMLILGDRTLANFPIMNTSLSGMGLHKVHADGVLGQDVMRQFKSVRIDYNSHTVTLE
jgi:hypothetical protein